MEIIWDFKLIPLWEQSSLCHSGRISVALTIVWKAQGWVISFIRQLLPNYCKV